MTCPTPVPIFPNPLATASGSNALLDAFATNAHAINIQNYCLFLDIDGTLAPFVLDPKASVIPTATLATLAQLQALGVMVCAVTGRAVAAARPLFAPLTLPIVGSHGLEIDLNFAETMVFSPAAEPAFIRSPQFFGEWTAIQQQLMRVCRSYPDLMLEEKPYSLALHFRKNPDLAERVNTFMQQLVADYPNWALKAGKCVWEILPRGADKGTGILSVLNYLEQATIVQSAKAQGDNVPFFAMFIGDDVTDEAGFVAVQNYPLVAAHIGHIHFTDHAYDLAKVKGGQGIGIKVGHEPTAARFFVKDIAEVAIFLQQFLQFLQQPLAKYKHNHEDN